MSLAFPIVMTVVMIIIALLGALSAYTAFGVYRRLRRVPTRPVSQLAEGPAELTGRVRAMDPPLATLDGTKVVALRTEIGTSYKPSSGSKTYQNPWAVDQTRATRIELTDSSGSCEIDPDHLMPLGSKRVTEMSGADFAKQHPELWSALSEENGPIIEVRVTETFVVNESDVFVSGQASATSPVEVGGDYRAARPRFRVHGADDRPLILSAWPENVVQRYVLRPVVLTASAAVFALSMVAVIWGMRAYIARIAGLD